MRGAPINLFVWSAVKLVKTTVPTSLFYDLLLLSVIYFWFSVIDILLSFSGIRYPYINKTNHPEIPVKIRFEEIKTMMTTAMILSIVGVAAVMNFAVPAVSEPEEEYDFT